MRGPGLARASLLGGALTLAAAAGALVLARATGRVWPGTGVVAVEDAVLTVALAGATVVTAWVSLVLGLATVELLRAQTDATGGAETAARAHSVPRPVRLTCAVLVALSGSTALPALAVPTATVQAQAHPAGLSTSAHPAGQSTSAQPGTPSASAGPADTGAGAPLPGSLSSPPSRPDGTARAVPQPGWTPTPQAPTPADRDSVALVSTLPPEALPDEVVVRRGDTLWDIAARHLGPGASAAEIAEEWPRWYAANLDVVGPDPDLIVPGTQLLAPAHGDAERLAGTAPTQDGGR